VTSLEELRQHPLPDWFDDAKLGIFVHWGLFSIPAFAAKLDHVSDAFSLHYYQGVVMTPYTEWYDNALRVPGSPSAEFHQKRYGDQPYESFREPFAKGLEQWDPQAWAQLFRQSGAGYLVLVAKHHDGYCLWPSEIHNPHRRDWTTRRDVVGELAAACRAEGLRFGVYYSGGIDWAWNRNPIRTLGQFVGSAPGGDYPKYAESQVRELIDRYEPSILWNDISWPSRLDSMVQLMADYYARVPEGVVNDRWMHRNLAMRLLSKRPIQRWVDRFLSRATRRAASRGESSKGIIPPRPAHFDFRTPEYTSFENITQEKWEATRGMSPSFGYNHQHEESDYEDPVSLLHSFIDTVSKNGNLLLNVGPRGIDAGIPLPQIRRLEFLGNWLASNGRAIYGTRPWHLAEGMTADGTSLRFTLSPARKGSQGRDREEALNVILLGTPSGREIVFPSLTPQSDTQALCLADDRRCEVRTVGGALHIAFDAPLQTEPAHAFQIYPVPIHQSREG
jgi:alpha-L-fucosidase